MANYTYDSWGNLISITDVNGNTITDANHIGNLNPFRYKGYYYDTDTGLYYLQSRYYNSEWGKFLISVSIAFIAKVAIAVLTTYIVVNVANTVIDYASQYATSSSSSSKNKSSKNTNNTNATSSKTKKSTVKNNVNNKQRVDSALKTDSHHSFPDIVDNYAGFADKFRIPNGDLYQLKGSLNGVSGRFKWITQGGKVTHRMFIKGGGVNGIPIMP